MQTKELLQEELQEALQLYQQMVQQIQEEEFQKQQKHNLFSWAVLQEITGQKKIFCTQFILIKKQLYNFFRIFKQFFYFHSLFQNNKKLYNNYYDI